MGDGGLGMGDWGLGPIPNPQSPIPNPQSPILEFTFNYLFIIIRKIISEIIYIIKPFIIKNYKIVKNIIFQIK